MVPADLDLANGELGPRTGPSASGHDQRAARRALPAANRERPSTSRVYDYFLGGENNLPVDRALAAKLSATLPDIGAIMRENRAFLRRAVRFLADIGVRQFLDLGSGIPTAGNVHEVAQRRGRRARVVYVDLDPTAVARSRRLLAGNPSATIVQADLRDPRAVLGHPEVRRLIDLAEPVAVLILGVLHDIPDADDPAAIIAGFRDSLAPGSFLALSQAMAGTRPEAGKATNAYNDGYAGGAPRLSLRDRAQTLEFFSGFDLVAPGLVFLEDWRPDRAQSARATSSRTKPTRARPVSAHVGRAPEQPVPEGLVPGHRAALCGIGIR